MTLVHSFPPVVATAARALIVGSMPGVASLQAQRYYAHPRNAFWPIVAAVGGFAADAPYAQRLAALQQRGVALWDVLQSCERRGSLDSDIAPASQRVNDFAALFAVQPGLRAVLCNGGTAHDLFVRHVAPIAPPGLTVVRLPSTSPAHASSSFLQKLAAWRQALTPWLA